MDNKLSKALSKVTSVLFLITFVVLCAALLYLIVTGVFVSYNEKQYFKIYEKGTKIYTIQLDSSSYIVKNLDKDKKIAEIRERDMGSSIKLESVDGGDKIGIINKDSENLVKEWKVSEEVSPVSEPSPSAPTNCSSLKYKKDGGEYLVTNDTELQCIPANSLSADYKMPNHINASKTDMWNGGSGFKPIDGFTGTFDGQGNEIIGVYMDKKDSYETGLFTSFDGKISNVNLKNSITKVSNSGKSTAIGGNLVSINDGKIVDSSSSSGKIIISAVNESGGGLVGENRGTIKGSRSTDRVNSEGGGLVGENNNGKILNSEAHGDVGGGDYVGGLVGRANGGTIADSEASGDVSGSHAVGGLAGSSSSNMTIVRSYSHGHVTGNNANRVGGLVGGSYFIIKKSYSSSTVTAPNSENVGGLVGLSYRPVKNSYSIGIVVGGNYTGGLVGNLQSDAKRSYTSSTILDGNTKGVLIGKGGNASSDVDYLYWEARTGSDSIIGGVGEGKYSSWVIEDLEYDEMTGSSARSNMNFDFTSIWETRDWVYPRHRW